MKQKKVTKEEVELLKSFMFEKNALIEALGKVERRKSNFINKIIDRYNLPEAESYSIDHKTRKILIIYKEENEKKK